MKTRLDKVAEILEEKVNYMEKHVSPYGDDCVIQWKIIEALQLVLEAIKESKNET